MEQIRAERSLTERVTEHVRQAILDGEFEPGSLYAVHTVAAQLGVSRTPVREALIRLAAQGMLRFERNRGFVILRPSSRDLRDIFCLRLLLEVPATRAAALIATPDGVAQLDEDVKEMRSAAALGDAPSLLAADRRFHRNLLTIGGNERLAAFVDELRDVILARNLSTADRSRTADDVLAPHQDLLRQVRDGDADEAAETMRSHVISTAQLLMAQEFGSEAVRDFDEAVSRMGAFPA